MWKIGPMKTVSLEKTIKNAIFEYINIYSIVLALRVSSAKQIAKQAAALQ